MPEDYYVDRAAKMERIIEKRFRRWRRLPTHWDLGISKILRDALLNFELHKQVRWASHSTALGMEFNLLSGMLGIVFNVLSGTLGMEFNPLSGTLGMEFNFLSGMLSMNSISFQVH